ncbi:MAG TPA: MOSC domain-containing protein [Chthonomonadaceae bacterium]|nr:MOSC domain-containing protein [Chthonomonadaceae bacterium]
MSRLVSIVYKPQDAPPSEDGYTRVPLQEARLVAGYGIEGDAKGGHPERHLNIMSAETVQTLGGEGFRTSPGQLGEQLLLSGVAVDSLPFGTRLQIGEAACVELREPRTGCAKFEQHQDRLRQEAAGRLGRMAQVVESGVIRVGDPVKVL